MPGCGAKTTAHVSVQCVAEVDDFGASLTRRVSFCSISDDLVEFGSMKVLHALGVGVAIWLNAGSHDTI